ncbi:MAG: SBBP repeat-containing protein [Bacteroidetes bacterium]|nr:SBBP repeat-containing protein [Bacteroidota bacterium]
MARSKIEKSFCILHFAFYNLTFLLLTLVTFSAYSKDNSLKGISNPAPAFIENKGQIIDQHYKPNPGVLYLMHTPGLNVQLRKGGFSYDVYSPTPGPSPKREGNRNRHSPAPNGEGVGGRGCSYHRIDIDLINSNPNPTIIPSDPASDYFNYFTSSAPPEGIKHVRQFSKITYKEIYPDIDLEFFTNKEHGYKYNFKIHPGANINDIRLRINGPDHISLIQDTLKFGTRFGDIEELIPESYYMLNDSRVDIQTRFAKINDGVYGFSVNKSVPKNSVLVIDPTPKRLWGTYYGGDNDDKGSYCATDKFGNVFLAGQTLSDNNIASSGAYQGARAGNWDGFVAKFNANGSRQWGTYFGGIALDEVSGQGIATDKNGNVYVSGDTKSTTGIATIGAHQVTYGGGLYDCYVEKFNSDGARVWGTYYGGANSDIGGSVAVDKNNYLLLTGRSSSDTGIATLGTYQATLYNTSLDAFIAKFDSNGIRQWGSYFGGEMNDESYSCSTDSAGNIYFCGNTNSTSNIASPGAHQSTYGGGLHDAFLAKFTSSGQRLWSTYYGGSLEDNAFGCKADSNGDVCLVGQTNSTNAIASNGSHQPVFGGGIYNAFIVKFDSLGQRSWGTYYGGNGGDDAQDCAFGWNHYLFIAGHTVSTNNISTPGGYQFTYGGIGDAFLVKFDSAGQRQWGTYYGGSSVESFNGCTYMHDDTIFCSGMTQSSNNIASPGAWQQYFDNVEDCMLIKFLDCWPIDTAGPITGPMNVCLNATGINYSIPTLQHVVNYFWTLPSGATIVSGAGTNNILVNFSGSATSGNIWVKGLNKCGDPGDSAYLFVTINTNLPIPVITGPNNVCEGPGKVYSTDAGKTNYQWSISPGGIQTSGGTSTDNTVTVTWNVVGIQHVYVNYNDNGCEALTPTDYSVTVTASPAVNVTISAPLNTVCEGTQVTYSATPTNGGTLPSYEWKVNGVNAGTDSPTYSYIPANGDQIFCILTSNATCSSNNPDTSNTIIMTVNPPSPVSVIIATFDNPVCAGSSVTFTATTTNGGSAPSYQWFVNGTGGWPSAPTMSYSPANGDIVNCIFTSSNTVCISNNPATSNAISMTVNPLNPVSVSISTSQNPFCQGSTVTFAATPINGGTTPTYLWKVNGIGVGSNNPDYSYTPANGDLVTCVLNSNIACPTGNPATSNTITMVENTVNPVSIVITTPVTTVCSGTSVIFTTTPTNGGTTPVYQWKVNGINVGANNSTFGYVPVNGDVVSCALTSNLMCASGNPASSNTITMTVNPNLAVSVVITASDHTVCSGSSVTFSATPTNGGTTPVYQWRVNGGGVWPNASTMSYTPVNGDFVSCILNSNATCPTGNPATSNTITMTVTANMPVSILISASNNPVCSGIPVTYTATPTNGGTTPVYLWKVNGINTGTNSTTYQYVPVNGDLITCTLTSNLTCTSGNPAISNIITMGVAASPIVTLTRCNDSITTTTAQPFRLKGGIPLGGTFSGPGVTNGIFYPAIAGVGTHIIIYTYTNAALCSASASRSLVISNSSLVVCGNPLTDIRDNKVYPTVQIGSQCWFGANLSFGTMISGSISQRDNCINEKYCLNDITGNCELGTVYYQWDELMAYDETLSTQGLCPPGWHVPSEADWNTLFGNYISNAFAAWPLLFTGYSGFNATLSGTRHLNKTWDWSGFATFFWSSTTHGINKAWSYGMNGTDPSISLYPAFRSNAYSVRCLKD